MANKGLLSPEKIAAIAALKKAGKSNKEIASQTGLALRSVQRWAKACEDAGDADPPLQRYSPGRPRKTSPRTLKIIKRQVDENPHLTARKVKEKNPLLLGEVSTRTVARRLHDDLHFKQYRARKKPLLSLKQRQKRVAFCKKYLQWDEEKWEKVLWSDEATFYVTWGGEGRNIKRHPKSDPLNPKFTSKTVKWPDSLMVWGCFGYHGAGNLEVLPKNVTVNADRYLGVIAENLPESFEKCGSDVFMQDGAPCHTAKLIRNWFQWVDVDYIIDWPGNSPDLNPIENLWSIIKARLRNLDCSTTDLLEENLKSIWANLDPQLLQNLASSVPRRLQECIRRKGYPTKY